MIFLLLGCSLLGLTLLLPTLSDLLSLAAIGFGRPSAPRAAPGPGEVPRLLVLVPAHDEEMLLAACLQSLMRLRYPADRYSITVIADNCTDRTAGVARAAGVRCVERTDPARPGKPRAIAWALQQLSIAEYDAVVIVDADTVVAPDFAAALAKAAPLDGKAVQGYFDVHNRTETALTRLAAVLAAANHRFAYPLKKRAGLNTPLVGNGMCIGTRVLLQHGWRAFSICEDWELYAQLTERGVPIECVPDAVVYAQAAHTLRASLSQRQRWTAGKLTVFARSGLPILRSGQISPRQKLDAIAELSALGPVLHLSLGALLIGVSLACRFPTALTLVFGASLFRPLAYTVAALRVQPDPAATLAAFAFLPVYALWRIGAAVAALKMLGETPWIRSERHHHVT